MMDKGVGFTLAGVCTSVRGGFRTKHVFARNNGSSTALMIVSDYVLCRWRSVIGSFPNLPHCGSTSEYPKSIHAHHLFPLHSIII